MEEQTVVVLDEGINAKEVAAAAACCAAGSPISLRTEPDPSA